VVRARRALEAAVQASRRHHWPWIALLQVVLPQLPLLLLLLLLLLPLPLLILLLVLRL
jgi:hypothetical protein